MLAFANFWGHFGAFMVLNLAGERYSEAVLDAKNGPSSAKNLPDWEVKNWPRNSIFDSIWAKTSFRNLDLAIFVVVVMKLICN